MTQEQKQLLLKDLCARLPYGVKFSCKDIKGIWTLTGISKVKDDEYICFPGLPNLDVIIPYLRPMSSMTEEEREKVQKLGVCDGGAFHNDIYDVGISMEEAFTAISWLLERHFDINYLIEKGLALEAPEGMYE